MMMIQQQLLPVVSKKLKDSLPNSFFTCSSAKAHMQYLFCCNNVASCSLKPRLTSFGFEASLPVLHAYYISVVV